jgi:hypothetical protein
MNKQPHPLVAYVTSDLPSKEGRKKHRIYFALLFREGLARVSETEGLFDLGEIFGA